MGLMENIQELKVLLNRPQDVIIISHRNPDGDAIGSSLALYHFLQGLGHTPKVIFPSEYPESFSWLPGIHDTIVYDLEPDESKDLVEKAGLFFCLDFNALDRIDKLGDLMMTNEAPKVMIDHHLYPEGFADFTLSETSASSTCELIFDFIRMLEMGRYMTIPVAECIFTGIITDTGSFRYSTSPKLYRVVADLVEMGIDDYALQDLINNNMDEKHLRLLGHCLYNRMEVLEEYATAIITLTKEDYTEFDIQRGDTEGIVNYLLRLRKITLAAFITEQPTIVKISLRSKGDFSVQEICQKHFKGGGHRNASGGASFIGLRATVRKFMELLPLYKEQLTAQTRNLI